MNVFRANSTNRVLPLAPDSEMYLKSQYHHANSSADILAFRDSQTKISLNPFLPGKPYKGHRQTVQTSHDVASDQGLYRFLTIFYIKKIIKLT